MASPFRRTASEEASSSRAWSSACSRSSRTRSRRNWNGRVTAVLVGSLGGLLTADGRLFDVAAGVGGRVVRVERLDPQRPLAVHEDEAAGAEVAAVDDQVGGGGGVRVEGDDRALRPAHRESPPPLRPAR